MRKRVRDAIGYLRELGCDEDEATFEEKLKRIAKRRPKPEAKKDR